MKKSNEQESVAPAITPAESKLLIGFISSILFIFFSFMTYEPIDIVKAFIFILIISFIIYDRLKNWFANFLEQNKINSRKSHTLFAFIIIGLSGGIILSSNALLDRNSATEYISKANKKYFDDGTGFVSTILSNHSTRHEPHYYIQYTNPVSINRFFLFGKKIDMMVSEQEYPQVIIGETKVKTKISHGFLGMDWITKQELILKP